MQNLNAVLGGGEIVAPKYHDFMEGVDLNFITDDAGVEAMLI